MQRNLIVLCDGTGNEVEGDLSNVLKLYRMAIKDERQKVFYEPGVGTIGDDDAWARIRRNIRSVWGLATGMGLDDNILSAYRFLCSVHEPGDRIFLFGFSRGAYTVRALAGLIHMVGLLYPEQSNLANYALTSYKRSSRLDDLHIAWDFKRIVGGRRATIHFLGLWDTVASMIVPRPDRLYLPSLQRLPFTRENPSVRAVRHAMAIDERRRMFRMNRWVDDQPFVEDPFAEPADRVAQDVKQVWFMGVHADIGGGYPELESGLSKFPLLWMLEEAMVGISKSLCRSWTLRSLRLPIARLHLRPICRERCRVGRTKKSRLVHCDGNPQGSDAGHPGYGAVHAPFALSVRFRTALVPTPVS